MKTYPAKTQVTFTVLCEAVNHEMLFYLPTALLLQLIIVRLQLPDMLQLSEYLKDVFTYKSYNVTPVYLDVLRNRLIFWSVEI